VGGAAARGGACEGPSLGGGARGGGDKQAQARLVAAATDPIRADARRDAPILRVDCDPLGRGRYECLAVTADVPSTERTPAGASGFAYRVLIDYESGRYGYCRLAPRATQVQREPVPLSPLCGGGG